MNKLIKIGNKKSIKILITALAVFLIAGVMFVNFDALVSKPDFQIKIESAATILKEGDVVILVDPGATKLCFQSAYVSQQDYELAVGSRVDFKNIESDSQFRFHVFYENGSHQQALMGDERIRLDRQNITKPCANTKSIRLKKSQGFILINFN